MGFQGEEHDDMDDDTDRDRDRDWDMDMDMWPQLAAALRRRTRLRRTVGAGWITGESANATWADSRDWRAHLHCKKKMHATKEDVRAGGDYQPACISQKNPNPMKKSSLS